MINESHGSNRVQNCLVVFWPQAAEGGFQNPSPLGEGSGPNRGKRVGGRRLGPEVGNDLDPAGGAA